MKLIYTFFRLLFVAFVIAFAVTFYMRYQLLPIANVNPNTLADPVQTKVTNSTDITFKNAGYSYVATPLYDYKITGVVVSKYDYNPADDDVEKVIRYDLCMVWGSNVADNIYLSPNITFSQSQRYCNYRYTKDVGLHTNQISNNHLVTIDSSILDVLSQIEEGDEVAITGKLVNMTASGSSKDSSAAQTRTWETSTVRDDTEAGACEVIYVESIKIITQAHALDMAVNAYTLQAMAVLLALGLLRFIWFMIFVRPARIK